MKKLAALIFTTAAAACGGGSNPVVIIDAPEEVDAAPSNLCPFVADLGGLGIGPAMGDCAGAAGCTGDWIEIPDAGVMTPPGGPNEGKATFWIFANLDMLPELDNDPNASGSNVIGIEVISTAGNFTPGVKTFDTTPTVVAGTFPFQMGTQAYTAAAYLIGKLDTGGTFSHLYSATSGSVNITAIQTAPADGSAIKATVAATAFSETDGTAFQGESCTDVGGECVSNTCKAAVQGLSFNLTQMEEADAKRTVERKSMMQKAIANIKQMQRR